MRMDRCSSNRFTPASLVTSRVNELSSTAGKNSPPRRKKNGVVTIMKRTAAPTTRPLRSSSDRITAVYFLSRRSKKPFSRGFAGSVPFVPKIWELKRGMSDRATRVDMTRAKEMVRARSRKRKPAIPGTNRIGRNTTSVVSVETTTGTPTSWAPITAAFLFPWPSSRNL